MRAAQEQVSPSVGGSFGQQHPRRASAERWGCCLLLVLVFAGACVPAAAGVLSRRGRGRGDKRRFSTRQCGCGGGIPSPPPPTQPQADCSTCAQDQYESIPCDESQGKDRECKACSEQSCGSGQYRPICPLSSSSGTCCGYSEKGSCEECGSCGEGMYLHGCSGVNAGTCIACPSCPAGQYSKGCGEMSAGTCTNCPEGKFASGPGARTSCTTCNSCPAGKAQAATCTLDADTTCRDLQCSSCSPGSYLTGCDINANEMGECRDCMACGINQYLSGCGGDQAGACEECPANMESEAGSRLREDCQCAAGYQMESGGACLKCEAGKYSGTVGGSCTSCEAGAFAADQGATSCLSCAESCAIGQVETTACGSNGGAADRTCSACDEDTKPSNSQHTHANDCSRWACKDGYTALPTPGGNFSSRCVLPSPADTSSVFTVSVEVVLPLSVVQVRKQGEQLLKALSRLCEEDAGNVFLLSVATYSAARKASTLVLGRNLPSKTSEEASRATDLELELSRRSRQGKRRRRLPAAAPSIQGHQDDWHQSPRSSSSVTLGVRTVEPRRVEQAVSLGGLNDELSAVGLPAASRLSAVYSSPGDLTAQAPGTHGAPAAGGVGAEGVASGSATEAGAASPAADVGVSAVDPVAVILGIAGGLCALLCCLLATYLKCRRNGIGPRRPAQVDASSCQAYSRSRLQPMSAQLAPQEQGRSQGGHLAPQKAGQGRWRDSGRASDVPPGSVYK